MTVVFINEPTTMERKAPEPELLASRGLAPVDLPIVVLSPDALPAADAASRESEQDNSAPPEAAGDAAQHALLYGRYLGQLQARIERAWMRPRTDIGAARFSCRVRIEQDRLGKVISIELDHCNGTERWQHSLVSAIRTASPLPAPPDPSVYADRLWLSFVSEGFKPGGPVEGFEPQRRDILTADDRYLERHSLEHLNDRFGARLGLKEKESSGVVHLTIIGTPDETSAGAAAKPRVEPEANAPVIPSSPQ